MFVVLAIVVLGVIIGTQIQFPKAPAFFSKLLNIIVYVLLLVMGIVVGGNERIVNNLSTIGLQAFIITLGTVFGSMIVAALIYKKIYKGGEQK
ncbi:MAG: LysO family transporter [Rikenellaceae bacterium]